MKRSGGLRRTGFKRPAREKRERQYPSPPAQPVRSVVVASQKTVRAVPKSPHDENDALLELARDRPCLFRWRRACSGEDGSTTVACHENRLAANKGLGYKANDWRSAWGCFACHSAFDQPASSLGLSREELDAVFDAAWRRQLVEWVRIAQNPGQRKRARDAAMWAVDRSALWLEEHGDVEAARLLRDAWRAWQVLPLRAVSLDDVRRVLCRHVQGREGPPERPASAL